MSTTKASGERRSTVTPDDVHLVLDGTVRCFLLEEDYHNGMEMESSICKPDPRIGNVEHIFDGVHALNVLGPIDNLARRGVCSVLTL
jgi:hypothetical protein